MRSKISTLNVVLSSFWKLAMMYTKVFVNHIQLTRIIEDFASNFGERSTKEVDEKHSGKKAAYCIRADGGDLGHLKKKIDALMYTFHIIMYLETVEYLNLL